MGKVRTVTDPIAGTNIVESWGDAVYSDIGDIFADKRVYTESDAATITFDLDNGSIQKVELAGNRTLAVSNVESNQVFLLILKQDSSGSRTVTWFSTIAWTNGITPVLTTTANKHDIFGFIQTSAGNYLGITVAQNM